MGIMLFMAVVMSPLAVWCQKTSDVDVFERIMANIRQLQQQNLPEGIVTGRTVNASLSTITSEGSWPDINYKSRRQTAWEPSAHLLRIHSFALAYTNKSASMYANNSLFAAIVNALEFWYNADPRSTNWWNQQIFCPKQIGEILIVLRAGKYQVPSSLEAKLLERMALIGGTPDGEYSTGSANRVNISAHWIYRGCLLKSKEVLERGIRNYMLPLRFCLPGEGLQRDFSFQEHGRQLYIGNYGNAFVDNVSEGALFLRETPYALSGEQLQLFSYFVRNTYLNALRGKYYSFAIPGRQIANKNALDKSGTTDILDRMMLVDPAHAEVYKAARERWSGAKPSSYKVNPLHNHYRVSDFTTHIRPGYYFDVRFVSSRTVRTENVNNENKKGFFLADGATNITINGNEYFNVFPTWDWCKVPGVTAPLLDTLPDMKNKSGGAPGISPFAGGVSDSFNGVSTYTLDYLAFQIKARKSWFCFDKEIVCLGSGIQSTSDAVIGTTVNQCLLNGKVYGKEGDNMIARSDLFDGLKTDKPLKWVLHNGLGYVFPGDQSVHVSAKKQTGNWYTISESQKNEEVTQKVFTVWMDHGRKPGKEAYAYIIVPGINKPEQMEEYAEKSTIQIIANNDSIQVVSNKESGITQAVLLKDNQVVPINDRYGLRFTAPAVAMIQHREGKWLLHIADPTQLLTLIQVDVINRKTGARERMLSVDLPRGDEAGSTTALEIAAD